MKIGISILLVLAVTLLKCQEQHAKVIDIKFTTQLTQQDLDKIQEGLKSQNIELTYDFLEFDQHGHLRKISASIDYHDGQSGSFTSRVLQPSDSPGFYRVY